MNVLLQKATGVLSGLVVDGPWRSKSVLTALAAVLAGVGIWFHGLSNNPPADGTGNAMTSASATVSAGAANSSSNSHRDWSKPFPFYVPIGASYVAGFCIGWFFRKLIRMILVVTALVVALLAFGKFAGCNVTPAQERVKQTSEWARHEAMTAKDYLMKLLPSAGAGGAGAYLGFRRRGKAATPSREPKPIRRSNEPWAGDPYR